MTSVFLDTNIIIGAGFFRSAFAEGFLKGAKFLDIEVLIPEIVIDEVKGNFASDVTELFNEYKRNHKHLGKFMDMPDLNIILDAKIAEYNIFFDKLLKDHGVIILDYPKTPPKELVVKSYEAKKPFKATGEGHKDYLIWETIKEVYVARRYIPESFFITDDKKDFCKKMPDGTFILHSDLVDSLEGIAKPPSVVKSLQEFFDLKIQPSLKNLNKRDIPNFNIEKYVESILEKEIMDYSADAFEELPFEDDIYISYVEELADKRDIQISEVEKDNSLIKVNGTASILVEGSMSLGDHELAIEQDIDIDDIDLRGYYMSVSKNIETPFELAILYSKKDKKILNHTISLPNAIYHGHYK